MDCSDENCSKPPRPCHWFSCAHSGWTRFGLHRPMSRPSGDADRERMLVLVELHGGDDGLNTFVPFDDGAYYRARPQLAISREQVRQLTPKFGFHPALTPLMSLWEGKELALVSGVGYPARIVPISGRSKFGRPPRTARSWWIKDGCRVSFNNSLCPRHSPRRAFFSAKGMLGR